jgi:hypothetical protein
VVFAVAAYGADTFVQGQRVQITDTISTNVVTTTLVGPKRALDVNVAASSGSTTVTGTKSNNAVVPGATNLGVLPAVATAAAPTYTESFQVALSTDLSGALRVSSSGGGTSSTFGAAFPATGTASGWSDGTNMQGARVFDEDTGGGTQYVAGASIRFAGAGGSTEAAAGAGVTTASTLRCVLPTDQTAIPATQSGTWNVRVQDTSGNGIESAITEVVGTNRGLLIRPVDKTLTAPVITAVSCGTTSTALPTTAGRKTICIENEGGGDIFIGPTGVTTATGFPIGVNSFWCDDVGSQAYFCINAAGTNDVRVLEN